MKKKEMCTFGLEGVFCKPPPLEEPLEGLLVMGADPDAAGLGAL